MARDDRPFDALERLARAVNARRPASLLRGVRGAMERQVRDAGVKALDDLVGRIAGHPVDTRTPEPPEPGPSPTPPAATEASGAPPAVAEPAPAVAEPAPTVAEPAPTVAEPAPAVAESAPAVAESAPAVAESARPSAGSTPASVAPETDGIRPSDRPTRTALPPEGFGIDRVVLLFRGPERALVYWETAPERRIAEGPGELRLVDADGEAMVLASPVALARGRCYFVPICDGRRWVAELWTRGAEGSIRVSRSTPVEAPSASLG